MKLSVNGEPRELPVSIDTLAALLELLHYRMPVFVVALNGVTVEPADYAGCPVAEGDSVEVYNLISGG